MVIDKTRSGAFYGTGLDAALRLRGIETAVFCGVVLNNCVESSIREAADRDYDCVVVSDGVAALDQAMYDASMRVLSGSYARVMTSRQVVEAMGRAARGRK
jgi:nicotinamidase-related amidase